MSKYCLLEVDGNAYAIMGYVKNAMRQEGRTKEEINGYIKDATSSDYDHLLAVSFEMVEMLNEKHEEDGDGQD